VALATCLKPGKSSAGYLAIVIFYLTNDSQACQQQRFREYQAKQQEAHPPPLPVPSAPKPTRQKTGRTEAQYRWGRQTFSPRMLKQANGTKL